jgi:hypothetical protein
MRLGEYSEGPGVSFDRRITKSTSDFGLASLILHADEFLTVLGEY